MQDTVNAFVSVFTVDGAPGGPLAGKTFAAKDLYDVAGHVTGCGNPDWARTHEVATEHAPPVTALLGDGATLVGKTHTDELAYSLMGVNEPYMLLSGYRSPQTNAMLRSRSRGVAKNSLHMRGQAADLRLKSRSVPQMARAAAACAAGGVGKYSGSNFVHMDCGPVRVWGG